MAKIYHSSLLLIISASFILLSGCTSQKLLSKSDYSSALEAFSKGTPDDTLSYFPQGEKNTFITTMEKAYLDLLQGRPNIDELEKYSRVIEKRIRIQISREVKNFFYMDLPEGYYASEHEIIWLHLLLGWGYSLRGKEEDACVEARKSAQLLTSPWSYEDHFDDPMLRIFLTGLWSMCGSWEDARVDLRAAMNLDPNLEWTKNLSHSDEPPKHIVLILGGMGPDISWDPELGPNPMRSARNLEFRLRGKKTPLIIRDSSGQELHPYLSPDSSNWYRRHWIRNNALQEMIDDSKYGQVVLKSTTIAAGKALAGTTKGVIIGSAIAALGAGISYLGIEAEDGDTTILGLAIIYGGVKAGAKIIKDSATESYKNMKEDLDASKQYRFVRFLPEYIWFGWSFDDLEYPLFLQSKEWNTYLGKAYALNLGHIKVTIFHFPDA